MSAPLGVMAQLEAVACALDQAERALEEAVTLGYRGGFARRLDELDTSWQALHRRAQVDAEGALGVIDILERRVAAALAEARTLDKPLATLSAARTLLDHHARPLLHEARRLAEARGVESVPITFYGRKSEWSVAQSEAMIDEALALADAPRALASAREALRRTAHLVEALRRAGEVEALTARLTEARARPEVTHAHSISAEQARRAYAEAYDAIEERASRAGSSDELRLGRAALADARARLAAKDYAGAREIACAAREWFEAAVARDEAVDEAVRCTLERVPL